MIETNVYYDDIIYSPHSFQKEIVITAFETLFESVHYRGFALSVGYIVKHSYAAVTYLELLLMMSPLRFPLLLMNVKSVI